MILSRREFLRSLAAVPLLGSIIWSPGAARAREGGSQMRKASQRTEKVHVGAGTQDSVTTGSSGPSDDKGAPPSAAGPAAAASGKGAPARSGTAAGGSR